MTTPDDTNVASVSLVTPVPTSDSNSTAKPSGARSRTGTGSLPKAPRAKVESLDDALPKEMSGPVSFCFTVKNNKNFKKLYRTCFPELSLTLCPGRQCVVCEVLDKYFTHLYQRPEHRALLHKTYRSVAMPSAADRRDAGGGDEDQEEEDDAEEPHGVFLKQDPEDQDFQEMHLNLSLPSDTPKRLSKEQQEWLKQGLYDRLRIKDGLSLLTRLKKQVFKLKRLTPLPHQTVLIEHLQSYDWSGNTVDHYPPIMIYWKLGAGKTYGILFPFVDNPPPRVVIVCDLTNLGYFTACIAALPQHARSTVYEIYGYNELHRLIGGDLDFLQDAVVIVDEMHHFRCLTPSMLIDLEAFRRARGVFGLTGTPLMNQIDDMYALNVFMEFAPIQTLDDIKQEVEDGTYPLPILNARGEITAEFLLKMRKMYKGRVHFYSPDTAEDFDPSKVERRDIHVPMTWRQTLQYLFSSSQNVTIGTIPFSSSRRNAFDSMSRKVGNCMVDPADETSVIASPKFDAMTDYILQSTDFPIVIYSRYRKRGVHALTRWIQERAEVEGREFAMDELTGSIDSDARTRLRDAFNSKKVDILCMTPAGKQGVDLLGCSTFLFTEILDCQEEENQAAGRILRHDALKDKPNAIVQIVRFISTFPTRDPSADDRRAMEKDFCHEARLQHPRDIPFDLVEAMKENIEELMEDGGTADQKRAERNVKKHAILSPLMLCLKVSSIGKVAPELRREFAQLCQLSWPDAEEIADQKARAEQEEQKRVSAERAAERKRKQSMREAEAKSSESTAAGVVVLSGGKTSPLKASGKRKDSAKPQDSSNSKESGKRKASGTRKSTATGTTAPKSSGKRKASAKSDAKSSGRRPASGKRARTSPAKPTAVAVNEKTSE